MHVNPQSVFSSLGKTGCHVLTLIAYGLRQLDKLNDRDMFRAVSFFLDAYVAGKQCGVEDNFYVTDSSRVINLGTSVVAHESFRGTWPQAVKKIHPGSSFVVEIQDTSSPSGSHFVLAECRANGKDPNPYCVFDPLGGLEESFINLGSIKTVRLFEFGM